MLNVNIVKVLKVAQDSEFRQKSLICVAMFKYITRFNILRQYHHRYKSSHMGLKTNFEKNSENIIVNTKNSEERSVDIDKDTIDLLERLSLVDCTGQNAVSVLTDAINFANKILDINTDGVEPMYTVLENRYLTLREDEVTEGNCKKDIIKNASVTEESYFVAPPGNIPLPPKK